LLHGTCICTHVGLFMATVAAYEIARRQNQRLAESGLQQGLRARIGDCCMV